MPDVEDRHVLAAAIRCNASVIVTFNEKDVPATALAPFGIEAQHPDLFVDNLFDLDQVAVVAAAQRQRAQLSNPPLDVDRYLDVLLRQGLGTVKGLGVGPAAASLFECLWPGKPNSGARMGRPASRNAVEAAETAASDPSQRLPNPRAKLTLPISPPEQAVQSNGFIRRDEC